MEKEWEDKRGFKMTKTEGSIAIKMESFLKK